MSFGLQSAIDSIKDKFPDAVQDIKTFRGETTVVIKKEKINE